MVAIKATIHHLNEYVREFLQEVFWSLTLTPRCFSIRFLLQVVKYGVGDVTDQSCKTDLVPPTPILKDNKTFWRNSWTYLSQRFIVTFIATIYTWNESYAHHSFLEDAHQLWRHTVRSSFPFPPVYRAAISETFSSKSSEMLGFWSYFFL